MSAQFDRALCRAGLGSRRANFYMVGYFDGLLCNMLPEYVRGLPEWAFRAYVLGVAENYIEAEAIYRCIVELAYIDEINRRKQRKHCGGKQGCKGCANCPNRVK